MKIMSGMSDQADSVTTLPPALSILIPTYRRPTDLRRAVESILNQRDFNSKHRFQIIVSEDASGPNYQHEYTAIESAYSSDVKFLRNKVNLGMAENLKQLAEAAKSDYSLVLTDDDVLEIGALSHIFDLIKEARSKNTALVHTHRISVNETGQYVTTAGFSPLPTFVRSSPYAALSLCRKNYVLSGLLIKTTFLRRGEWIEHCENSYFPLAIAYFAILRGGVMKKRTSLVRHTVENQTHWHRWGGDTSEQEERLFKDQLLLLNDLYAHSLRYSSSKLSSTLLKIIHFRNQFGRLSAAIASNPNLNRKRLCQLVSNLNTLGGTRNIVTPAYLTGRLGSTVSSGVRVTLRFSRHRPSRLSQAKFVRPDITPAESAVRNKKGR